jgi:hypothetical protein
MYIEETLHAVMEDRKVLGRVNRWKGNRTGHTWRRNWLLKHVIDEKIEGGVEGTERRRRRGKQLLDGFMDKTVYWNLQENALDHIL